MTCGSPRKREAEGDKEEAGGIGPNRSEKSRSGSAAGEEEEEDGILRLLSLLASIE